MWLVHLVGCSEWFLHPNNETSEPAPQWETVEDTFVQSDSNPTDVLLVVDDTASMAQEQAALDGVLGPWLETLDALDIGWQIGVVTTDMEADDAGWLRGTPYVLTPDTLDREQMFAEMIAVGTFGLGAEAGLAAAITALDLTLEGPNAGFRRPDAALHIIFVSDTDDQSDAWLRDGPVSTFIDRMDDERAETGKPAIASAIVGPDPSGCTTTDGSAQAGSRYVDIALRTGGAFVNICEPTLAPIDAVLASQAALPRSDFLLSRAPVAESVQVLIDGARVGDWDVDASTAVVRFAAPPPVGSVITVRYLSEGPDEGGR